MIKLRNVCENRLDFKVFSRQIPALILYLGFYVKNDTFHSELNSLHKSQGLREDGLVDFEIKGILSHSSFRLL